MLKNLLRLMRVKQWVKNAFVIAPLIFSLKFTSYEAVAQNLLAALAFCFISSFIYILNDWLDIKKDALHPVKKNRPLASGRVSKPTAFFIAAFLLLGGLACAALLQASGKVLSVLGIYICLNLFYSLRLKHLVIIDVLTIAAGFILRVYAGSYAINVPVSSFIFMATLFLSLFLGFTKRKAELLGTSAQSRQVLENYSAAEIDKYILISATLTIMCYALYTLEPSTIARFDTNRLIYSVVFVIYGIFRYLYILERHGSSEDPTENLLKDKGLISVCVLYVAYVVALFLNLI